MYCVSNDCVCNGCVGKGCVGKDCVELSLNPVMIHAQLASVVFISEGPPSAVVKNGAVNA